MKRYNKLVRDKITDIIAADGRKFESRVLSDEEFRIELLRKLSEECNEVITAENKKDLIEELADLYEVMMAIASLEGVDFEEVVKAAKEKCARRGAFDKKIFLIGAEEK